MRSDLSAKRADSFGEVAEQQKLFYCVHMSLSDRERRLLAEMEEALSADDPRLVSALSGKGPGAISGGFLIGAGIILSGMAILFAGLLSKTTLIGVAGFIVALVGILLAIRGFGNVNLRAPRGVKGSKKGISSRLEDRWDQRNNG